MWNWKAVEKKKQLEGTKCRVLIVVWQQGGYPWREIWTKREAKGAHEIFALLLVFFSLQFTKNPVLHTCFLFKWFLVVFFFLFLLAAWEYPVCESRGKSNKNYWFWIGKKVHACVLIDHKLIRKQWKKYCIPTMMYLIHIGLLLFLGHICFF